MDNQQQMMQQLMMRMLAMQMQQQQQQQQFNNRLLMQMQLQFQTQMQMMMHIQGSGAHMVPQLQTPLRAVPALMASPHTAIMPATLNSVQVTQPTAATIPIAGRNSPIVEVTEESLATETSTKTEENKGPIVGTEVTQSAVGTPTTAENKRSTVEVPEMSPEDRKRKPEDDSQEDTRVLRSKMKKTE